MRLIIILKIFVLIFLALFSVTSCEKDEIKPDNNDDYLMDELSVNDGFLFLTTQEVNLSITLQTTSNNPIGGAIIEVYNLDPQIEANKEDLQLLFKGITNQNGNFDAIFSVPDYLDLIYVCPLFIGVSSQVELNVSSNISYTFGGNGKYFLKNKSFGSKDATYLFLGEYDTNGVPYYLADDDVVSSEFLQYVNAILPERQSVPDNHPEYIASGAEANIILIDSAEIWITFIHEGAGMKNALGYYSYPTNNPPQSADDIDNMTIIFPNSSFVNSGGGLTCGNKVKLMYNDPIRGFVDTFPENTTIGWFLIASAWQNEQLTNGIYIHYSDSEFNIENTNDLKRHSVFLLDPVNEIVILGFEDLRRDQSGCDHDFNDAVFYATISPYSAFSDDDIVIGDECTDTDNDGICDSLEDYPQDPIRAYNNFAFGSLAFEDLWYNKGDYDFNDLVTDYKINRVTNADNNVVDVISTFIVRAIGAGFHNGFGFEIPVSYTNVNNVVGCSLLHSYINTNSNGTEANQTNTVIIPFDDAYDILSNPTGGFVNVYNGHSLVPYDSITVSLTFINPLTQNEVGIPPFNPFLIKDGNRDYEVHLPGYTPTDLQNTDLFGNGDDDSNIDSNKYYLTENNLPWAIHIPEPFNHPTEKSQITFGYLFFKTWAESNGLLYPNWFQNYTGYRNYDYIYQGN
ncbi:MAG: LruC domain-containing protein [Bacteroidales bacterium]|nr:LruC domain-containing protein [Bacteroidales bacterium]